MHNDLQAAALKLAPDLAEVLELGEASGALAGIVSGSGPTLAFLVDSQASASELQQVFARHSIEALSVTGPVSGARIVQSSDLPKQ
jgi:4-diphosphocytidyl-2-C-methyl-D-erythritol kinase